MKTLNPRHIDEDEADNRSIKIGWYAMRGNGSLRLGPFLSREECLEQIARATPEPTRPGHWPSVR